MYIQFHRNCQWQLFMRDRYNKLSFFVLIFCCENWERRTYIKIVFLSRVSIPNFRIINQGETNLCENDYVWHQFCRKYKKLDVVTTWYGFGKKMKQSSLIVSRKEKTKRAKQGYFDCSHWSSPIEDLNRSYSIN